MKRTGKKQERVGGENAQFFHEFSSANCNKSSYQFRKVDPRPRHMSVTAVNYVMRLEGCQYPQEGTRNPCQHCPLETPRELGRLRVPGEIGILEVRDQVVVVSFR